MDEAVSINCCLKLLWNFVYIIIFGYMLIYNKMLKSADCIENMYIDI